MRGFALSLLLLLGACDRERSFDERYSRSEQEIEERARNIDAELNERNGSGDAE